MTGETSGRAAKGIMRAVWQSLWHSRTEGVLVLVDEIPVFVGFVGDPSSITSTSRIWGNI